MLLRDHPLCLAMVFLIDLPVWVWVDGQYEWR